MLVLTRKEGQKIMIGKQITIVVNWIKDDKVSLAIEAPADYAIDRPDAKRHTKIKVK